MNSLVKEYGAHLIRVAEAMEAKVEAHKSYVNLPPIVRNSVAVLASNAATQRADGEGLIAGTKDIRSLIENKDLTDDQIETILRARIDQGVK